MFDSVTLVLNNIFRKKFRSMLTILGIAIGVSAVVIIGSIGKCGSVAISDQLDSLGLGSLTISLNINTNTLFDLDDNVLETIKKTNHVVDVSPIVIKKVAAFNYKKNTDALLWGINSRSHNIVSLNPLFGRFFNRLDITNARNVCLVDQNFARASYGKENVVGKFISITIDDVTDDYEIIGIIQTGSGLLSNVMGDYIPNFIYMPYTTVQNCTGKINFDQIAVKIENPEELSSVSEDILKKLNGSVGTKDAYVSNSLAKQREGLTSVLNIITTVLSSIGIVSLLVASLSVMTVMLVSVNERTREIGIKKSIGASRTVILFEFLLEAVTLTLIGSLLGSIFGILFSILGTRIVGIEYHFDFFVVITSILTSIISGACFGIYPAIKAANMNPVEALRSE